MLARIEDPQGPRRLRWMVPALGIVLMLLDRLLFGAFVSPTFFVGVALVAVGGAWFRSFGAHPCTLEPSERGLHVRGAGWLSQHIDVRTVASASTARTPTGLALALGRRDGTVVTLHVDREEDGEVMRRALGIGRHGLRTLRFSAQRRDTHTMQRATRMLAVAAFLGFAMMRWLLPQAASPSMAVVLTLMVGAAAFATQGPSRTPFDGEWHLDDKGFAAGRGRYVECLRWSEIAHAFVRPSALVVVHVSGAVTRFPFDVPSYGGSGMTVDEARNVAYQITDAARRARGELPRMPELTSAELERRESDPRSFLERLDTMACGDHAMATYRSHGVDKAALRRLLESPDVKTGLRAAAARVLLKSDPRERGRIETAIYRVREDRARFYLRDFVCTDDDAAEEAAEELAPLTARS